MKRLEELLRDAKAGTHGACHSCPWNPEKKGLNPAFGTSCRKHGAGYGSSGGVLSVQVSEDPGGSGAEKTGLLCFVCNSDPTARNALSLWKAAVVRKPYGEGDEYLRGHYWTNATMHGFDKHNPARKMETWASPLS